MTLRTRTIVCFVGLGGLASLLSGAGHQANHWVHFWVYLISVLLSSGMKVAMPKTDGTMSVNFPFILLGILQLSPLQAVALAACSVIAQCNFRVVKSFSLIQTGFNVANVITATIVAWHSYSWLVHHHCEVAPALAICATLYFLANTIPVALIIGSTAGVSPIKQWSSHYPWYLPFYLVGAVIAAAAHFIGLSFGWPTSLLMIPLVYTIYRAYTSQMAMVRAREQQAIETEELQLRTIEGLAMAIEAKDKNTHEHLLRVRVYVSEIGKKKGVEEDVMKALVTASFLHDIGKLAVPEYIINKPGKLTREEFDKMKIHPSVGADILERVRFPYPVVPIVRSHHESWDGSGYPDGLQGEQIPLGARILSVVDCFDAMASERPYRRALPLAEAMAHVKKFAGIQFDPEIVAILDGCYVELEEKARQQMHEVKPLDTELFIHRGAAPGAGFEPEHDNQSSNPAEPKTDDRTGAIGQDIQSLSAFSLSAGNSTDACAALFAYLAPLVPFDCLAIYIKVGDVLATQFISGKLAHGFSTGTMAIGEGLSGWVAQSGRPLVNGNPTVEPTYQVATKLLTPTGSALAVPLFNPSGDPFGVLTVYSRANAAFSKDHLRLLQKVEPQLSASLANPSAKRMERMPELVTADTA